MASFKEARERAERLARGAQRLAQGTEAKSRQALEQGRDWAAAEHLRTLELEEAQRSRPFGKKLRGAPSALARKVPLVGSVISMWEAGRGRNFGSEVDLTIPQRLEKGVGAVLPGGGFIVREVASLVFHASYAHKTGNPDELARAALDAVKTGHGLWDRRKNRI